ncbi:hypothetical protein OM416_20465 [Paenibacillus sp. LS1]|uniref:hypothetical protein n=1 Tax=Paenibacillus sp. LS1 TaxID=2992120 RepID=UPI00222F8D15|nr:hypothetical protein [Paenibacillus sp. LS1]MCW3793972.1 hypothetical protein [Paenibacillus sp. LS1]
MQLLHIEIQGFKGFRYWSSEINDDSFATLTPSTSTDVTEAIIWCLKGCDRRGETLGIRRRLLHPEHNMIRVKTTWRHSSQQDNHIEIVREISFRRKTLLLNQRPINQDDIDSLMQPIDLQLGILSPMYFSSLTIPKFQTAISNLLFDVSPSPNNNEAPTKEDHLTPEAISTQLEILRDYVNESKAYVIDAKNQMAKAKLTSCLSDTQQALQDEQEELMMKMQEICLEDGPDYPDILIEWKEELASLGTLYRSRVDEWKELKASGDVKQLESIKKHCESLIHEGRILKSQIEKEEEFWKSQVLEFEKDKSHRLPILQQDLERLKATQTLRNNAENREDQLQLNYEQGVLALEEAKREMRALSKHRLSYVQQQVNEANTLFNDIKITLNHHWIKGEAKIKLDIRFKQMTLYDLSPEDQVQCSLEFIMYMMETNRNVIETHEFIKSPQSNSFDIETGMNSKIS